jgi:hypothetical protein
MTGFTVHTVNSMYRNLHKTKDTIFNFLAVQVPKTAWNPQEEFTQTPNRLNGSLMQTHNRNLPKNPETLAVCELKKSHDLESLDRSHRTVKPWRARVAGLKLSESREIVRRRGWLAVCVWGVLGPGLDGSWLAAWTAVDGWTVNAWDSESEKLSTWELSLSLKVWKQRQTQWQAVRCEDSEVNFCVTAWAVARALEVSFLFFF